MKTILLPFAAFAMTLGATTAQAGFTIDGDADNLVLVAEQATRAEIVTALAEKFDMEILGGSVQDGALDGRYAGTLGQVLKSILPANGYAIAYMDGKPARVTFTTGGASAVQLARPSDLPIDVIAPAPATDTKAESAPPSVESALERQAFTQTPAAAVQQPAPVDRATEPSDAQQMKEMTSRAVRELEALVKAVRDVER